jgi:hypothetical protein
MRKFTSASGEANRIWIASPSLSLAFLCSLLAGENHVIPHGELAVSHHACWADQLLDRATSLQVVNEHIIQN